MFDIGFWELALILVVALLVVGPERLPKLARSVGLWVGKARKIVSSVKADIEREIRAEELKTILEKQRTMPELQDLVDEGKREIRLDESASPSTPAHNTEPAPAPTRQDDGQESGARS